ncbi:Prp19/Pso4-like-domain-containing protein [Kockiozyma suomiensis]|uniref:Prp19/Pso4-like-domain-containing protein n=1 Tax=Kockiozyma suomiensis TaxID=1337062 RepID=UPI00334376F4
MLCGISGIAPKVAVISPKSGIPFEKSLLQAYVSEHGVDPVTNEPLTMEEVIEIKEPATPVARTPAQASIPSLMQTFQNEWDALALETLSLRQELLKTRQDLSTALYYHDAAVRVVARLTKERDDAVKELEQLSG